MLGSAVGGGAAKAMPMPTIADVSVSGDGGVAGWSARLYAMTKPRAEIGERVTDVLRRVGVRVLRLEPSTCSASTGEGAWWVTKNPGSGRIENAIRLAWRL